MVHGQSSWLRVSRAVLVCGLLLLMIAASGAPPSQRARPRANEPRPSPPVEGDLPDCNSNERPDAEDIANGVSRDCNGNGVPDECELTDYRRDEGGVELIIGDIIPESAPHWTLMNQFNVTFGAETINVIEGVFWVTGSFQVRVYDDPNNDGDPDDRVLLAGIDVPASSVLPYGTTRIPFPPTHVGSRGDSFFVAFSKQEGVQAQFIADRVSMASVTWAGTDGGAMNPQTLSIAMLRADGRHGDGLPLDCQRRGDGNGDGVVDELDLVALLDAWGDCPAAPEKCPQDTNRDDVVNVIDLLALLGGWG